MRLSQSLSSVPIEISAAAKQAAPSCFVFFGGHSVSFIAGDVLAQAEATVDAVVRGEGETAIGPLLEAVRDGGPEPCRGWYAPRGGAPAPRALHSIDSPRPARDLASPEAGANLARGQTNFARMLWKFNQVYNPDRQYAGQPARVRSQHQELRHITINLSVAGRPRPYAGTGLRSDEVADSCVRW